MNLRELDWQAARTFLRRNRAIALVILAGLLLLLWPEGSSGQRQEPQTEPVTAGICEYDLRELEEKLTETLSQIRGAGRTRVMLTLSATGQVRLAESRTQEGDTLKTDVVILRRGTNQEGVVEVERQYPVFLGALVVCEGGGEPRVRLELLRAVKALTGLRSEQISICEKTEGEVK